MATLLDKIKEKKSIKYGKISIKIPLVFKEKIDYICKNNDIDISEYLGAILENSEINKVYNRMKKEEKSRLSEDESFLDETPKSED
jgi:hypothetical protein